MRKILLLLLALAINAFAQQTSVAVLPSEGAVLGNEELEALTDKVREAALKVLHTRDFVLLKQDVVVRRLGGIENYIKKCVENSCIVDLGRQAQVDYVAQASVGKLGNKIKLKVELYSVSTEGLVGMLNDEAENLRGLLAIVEKRVPAEVFGKIIPGKNYFASITSDPEGANLSFDGEPYSNCTTPCKVELPAGSVRITADLEEYETADTTVSIKQNNQIINIKLKPNFGVLEVKPAYSEGIGKDEQWSLALNWQVFYSLENRLPPGKYKGELSHRCYEDVSFNLVVSKGKRQVFDMAKQVKLKKGGLVLKSEKNGEPVYANGKQVGKTPFSGSVPLCAEIEIGKDRERVEVVLEHNGRVEHIHEYEYEILYKRGEAYYYEGNYDLAIEDFNAVLKIKPDYYEALAWRGYMYYLKSNFDYAIEDFTSVLKIEPGYLNVLANRGKAYHLKGDYDQAIKDYTAALKIKPDNYVVLNSRGDAYYDKNNYDWAIEDYNAALRIKPDDYYTLLFRGKAYHEKGNYDQAIEDYNAALKIKPDFHEALHLRGDAHRFKGNYDQAIKDYNAALKIKPDFHDALHGRGYAYYDKGNYDQAIKDFEIVLKIDPNNIDAREYLEKARQKKAEASSYASKSYSPPTTQKNTKSYSYSSDSYKSNYNTGGYSYSSNSYKSNIRFFTDSRDGKKYKAVTIGTQTWMAENLNYNASGSKCYDNNSANCQRYGRLYDWYTAKTVCPKGWHLPSDAEWTKLTDYGGSSRAGKYLKATSGWNSNGNGQDTYGFAALPGGGGDSGGSFGSVGYGGYWWSASEDYSSYAYDRVMRYHNENVGYYRIDKGYLFSVRCLQD